MQLIKKFIFTLMIIISITTRAYAQDTQDTRNAKENNNSEIIQPEASEGGDSDLIYEDDTKAN